MLLFSGGCTMTTILLLGLATAAKGWSLKGRNDEIRLGLDSVDTGDKEAVTQELTDLLASIEQRHQSSDNSNAPKFDQGILTPSCFFLALSTLPRDSTTPCESLSRSDNQRVQVAARMAICELETIGGSSSRERGKVPKECEDWIKGRRGTEVGQCVEALSRSPQYWSSYSGYLREVVVLCSSYRRWADLETARNLYASTSTTFKDFLDSLREYEKLRSERERSNGVMQTKLSDHLNSLSSELSILRDALSTDHLSHTTDLDRIRESLVDSLDRFEEALTSKVHSAVASILADVGSGLSRLHEDATGDMKDLVLQHSKDLSTATEDLGTKLERISDQLGGVVGGVVASLIGLEESLERNTALVDRNAESLESIVIASRSIVSSLDRSAQSIDEQREQTLRTTKQHALQLTTLNELIANLQTQNEIFSIGRNDRVNFNWWWIVSAFTGLERGGFGIAGVGYAIFTFLVGRDHSFFQLVISISAGFLIVPILWRILAFSLRLGRPQQPPKYTSQADQFQLFLARQKNLSHQHTPASIDAPRHPPEETLPYTRIRRASRIPERWLR